MASIRAFQILEHPADIGFEAWGRTREEVFSNAARALVSISFDLETIAPCDEVNLHTDGSDGPSLLVNWLSEILFLQDTEGWLLRDFEIAGLTEQSIVATARGEKFRAGKHAVKLLVKAVTYHQLALESSAEGWRARVYVDI